jgi:hypothetical protein
VGDPTTTKAPTNTKPESCVGVQCDCNTMWSFTQQYCYLRLCTDVGNMKAQLVKDYAVRARRISATYASFYLEQEKGSNPAHKGRFYWMALGAFASKTVACLLETWQVKGQAILTDVTREGLGKGNFWLFCDIAGWHHYYCKYGDTFDMCLDCRNTNNLVPAIKAQTKIMPWSGEALPKVKQLAVSKEIKAGFASVKKYESTTKKEQRPDIQFQHLLAIADHEQGVILQPLIYDDPAFAAWVARQRWPIVKQISPALELVFSSACETIDLKLKSVAPDDTKLEEFESRMKWIRDAAKQFHSLMLAKTSYMEGEIGKMAGWFDMPDKK